MLGFHEQTKRMEVISLHPGVTFADVAEATGFEIGCREPVGTTATPTELELRILREEVDPHRYVIGRCSRTGK